MFLRASVYAVLLASQDVATTSALALTATNLTHPAVLAFVLGIVAVAIGSDLRFPAAAGKLLSSYLLLAIGLKGGVALAETPLTAIVLPAAATLFLGLTVPVAAYVVLRRLGRFSIADAAGIAAHYGSVSAVTFAAAVAFAVAAGSDPEAFLPALLALLEVPGIVLALAIAQKARRGTSMGPAVREVLTGSSALLLIGGLLVGGISGPAGLEKVAPVFVEPFAGVLVLFLLYLGTVAGERLWEVRKAGLFLGGFAVAMPLVFGTVGVFAGAAAGLSAGGAAVMGAMAGSASYIAAPAAVQVSLPDANLGYALTAALAITFPFNLALGIPLFHSLAHIIV